MSEIDISRLEILDECLTRIQRGEVSVLDCLNAHPHHQEYLESNLEAALHATKFEQSRQNLGRPGRKNQSGDWEFFDHPSPI
jgi:hypothetical protein